MKFPKTKANKKNVLYKLVFSILFKIWFNKTYKFLVNDFYKDFWLLIQKAKALMASNVSNPEGMI